MQHQINTGDHQAVKQRVRRYPAARREEEQKLLQDMLAIGIIQESSSAWSSPTVLVKTAAPDFALIIADSTRPRRSTPTRYPTLRTA